MKKKLNDLFGLPDEAKRQLISKMRERAGEVNSANTTAAYALYRNNKDIAEEFYSIESLPGYKQLHIQAAAAEKFSIDNPFFRCHDGVATNTTSIDNKELINYSSYNYLGLNGHPRVSQAAKNTIDKYGTSASASRTVSGERQIHRELECELAKVHKVEDSVIFVSGHAANVTTIGCLFGQRDLIVHDSLAHNSIIQGAILSGAKRLSFAHNDYQALDRVLSENRNKYERVLIVIEGLYSMDGDIPELKQFIQIKLRHKCFLMLDEAHSLGVLGQHGYGIAEHYGLEHDDVDIWMGTLSKSLAACGGYISGKRALVENLKYTAPGFVYSVGMSPPVAAAALESLKILQEEPQRVAKLHKISQEFIALAKQAELNTGSSQGYAIIPLIVGSSILAVKLSNRLYECGINVQPIIYPAVEERAARLRFFLSSLHTHAQIESTIEIVLQELNALQSSSLLTLP